MTGKHYSRTFANIPEEKQQLILSKAISEFAAKGYNATNVNIIAKEAGISIGSMYSYFSSKEALFLAIIDQAVNLLQTALKEVVQKPGDFFDKYREMITSAVRYAKEYRFLHQIYLEISTEGLSHIADELSTTMEKITTEVFDTMFRQAKDSGEIRSDIDSHIIAYCLDNITMMLQFSFASKYYYERMRLFLDDDIDEQRLIDSIIDFVRNGLSVNKES